MLRSKRLSWLIWWLLGVCQVMGATIAPTNAVDSSLNTSVAQYIQIGKGQFQELLQANARNDQRGESYKNHYVIDFAQGGQAIADFYDRTEAQNFKLTQSIINQIEADLNKLNQSLTAKGRIYVGVNLLFNNISQTQEAELFDAVKQNLQHKKLEQGATNVATKFSEIQSYIINQITTNAAGDKYVIVSYGRYGQTQPVFDKDTSPGQTPIKPTTVYKGIWAHQGFGGISYNTPSFGTTLKAVFDKIKNEQVATKIKEFTQAIANELLGVKTPTTPFTPKDGTYLQQLLTLTKPSIENQTSENGYTLRVIVTKASTSNEERLNLQNIIDHPADKDIILWIDYTSNKYDFYYGRGVPKEKVDNPLEDLVDDIVTYKQANFNPLAALLDGIATLVGELTIPPKFYNPALSNYNPILADLYELGSKGPKQPNTFIIDQVIQGATLDSPTYTKPRVEFAFYCGVYNGVIAQLQSIPAIAANLSRLQANFQDYVLVLIQDEGERVAFWNSINSLPQRSKQFINAFPDKASQLGSGLWTQIINAHSGNICVVSEQIGEDVVFAVTIAIAIAKTGTLASINQFLEAVDVSTYIFKPVGLATKYLWKVGSKTAQGIFKIGNSFARVVVRNGKLFLQVTRKTGEVFSDIDWSLVRILEVETTTGQRLVYGVYSPLQESAADAVRKIKEIVKDEQGRIPENNGFQLAVVEDVSGSERLAVITKIPILNDLPKLAQESLERLTPTSLKKLLDRLASNVELLEVIKQKPELTRLWTAHKTPPFTATEMAEAENIFAGLSEELSDEARNLAIELGEESGKKARMLEIFGLGRNFEDIAINAFKTKSGITNNLQIVRQVTLEVDGIAIRVDFLGLDNQGIYHIGESKFSTLDKNWATDWLSACTPNQTIVLPKIQTGNVTEYIVKATDTQKLADLSQIGLANNSKINFANTTFNIFGSQANQQTVKTIVTLK